MKKKEKKRKKRKDKIRKENGESKEQKYPQLHGKLISILCQSENLIFYC